MKPNAPAHELILNMGHGAPIYDFAAGQDGRRMATVGVDGSVIVWDLETRRMCSVPVYQDPAGTSGWIAMSADSEYLAVYLRRDVGVFRAADGRLLASFSRLDGPLAFSADGSLLIGAGQQEVKTLDWRRNVFRSAFAIANGDQQAYCRSLSTNGELVAVANVLPLRRSISIYDVNTGALRERRALHPRFQREYGSWNPEEPVEQVAVSLTHAAASGNGGVWVFPLGDQEHTGWLLPAESVYHRGLEFSPDGEFLTARLAEGATVWRVTDRGPTVTVADEVAEAGSVFGLKPFVVSTHGHETAITVPVGAVQDRRQVGVDRVAAVSVRYLEQGSLLEATYADGVSALWELPSGRLRETRASTFPDVSNYGFQGWRRLKQVSRYLPEPLDENRGCPLKASSDDGAMEAQVIPEPGCWTSRVVVRRTENGEIVSICDVVAIEGAQRFGDIPISLAFSPTNRAMVTGSFEHGLDVWDTATGDHVFRRHTEESEIISIAFSPDGRFVVSAAVRGNVIHFWKTEHLSSVKKIVTPNGMPFALAFSPSGEQLAVANGDGTITLWDTSLKQLVGSLFLSPPIAGSREWVSFTPEGRYISSLGGRNLISWRRNGALSTRAELYDRYHRPDLVEARLSLW